MRKYTSRIWLLIIFSLLITDLTFASTKPYYNVIEYGAKGDGQTADTKAIQKAIDQCNKNGGGTVEFPAGTYLTGTITLKNNVILNLQAGSKILGSKNIDDYPMSSLIWGNKLKNVGIIGFGIIDGQGVSFQGKKNRPALLQFVSCKNVTVVGVTLQHPGAWTQHS